MKADIVQPFDSLFVNEFRHRFPLFHKIDGEFGDVESGFRGFSAFFLPRPVALGPGGIVLFSSAAPARQRLLPFWLPSIDSNPIFHRSFKTMRGFPSNEASACAFSLLTPSSNTRACGRNFLDNSSSNFWAGAAAFEASPS
jgi:hypothetical protein